MPCNFLDNCARPALNGVVPCSCPLVISHPRYPLVACAPGVTVVTVMFAADPCHSQLCCRVPFIHAECVLSSVGISPQRCVFGLHSPVRFLLSPVLFTPCFHRPSNRQGQCLHANSVSRRVRYGYLPSSWLRVVTCCVHPAYLYTGRVDGQAARAKDISHGHDGGKEHICTRPLCKHGFAYGVRSARWKLPVPSVGAPVVG